VLVRDYGLYDHAMLRFAPGHKLADSFYVRQDGTRAYYFSTGTLLNVKNMMFVHGISQFAFHIQIHFLHWILNLKLLLQKY